ncbi:MAG: universal stress protein [Bacteroidetes bacterium]|nr:universal stress protein [Bacteroidota bacterium]MDA1122531.1 universal stress protein [Bacteroidota bacterium]
MKKILVPTDFSEEAEFAYEFAYEMAKKSKSSITLLNPHYS